MVQRYFCVKLQQEWQGAEERQAEPDWPIAAVNGEEQRGRQ